MKIVLAYSGGLDTSIILKWLKETYRAEVIAFTADIGQGEEVEEAREKALRTGASKAIALDLKEEFVRDFVFPMMRAGAVYEGYYLLGTSIARPLIAKHLVRIAEEEGAEAIAHGATGKGNDQVRFELTAYALKPDIKVIAPWREWSFQGRKEMIAYAEAHGIPVPVTQEKPYSMDANLLHISYEGGVLEDPWAEPPKGMFRMTQDPEEAPDAPEYVEVEFFEGDPVAVNGERLSPAALLQRLNEIGGRHGVGRVDIVENRFVGMKSRGVYETPGGRSSTTPGGRWKASPWTGRSSTKGTCSPPSTPSSSTTASGTPRSGRPFRPTLTTWREASPAWPGSSSTRGTSTWWEGRPRRASTARTWSPLTRQGATTRRTPRASSRSRPCASGCGPLWRGRAMAHRTWGGRFGEGPDALAARFNASLAFDRALWREDLWQNRVHARMLHAVGLLSAEELEAILKGLDRIEEEIEAGTFPWREELEDVHMNLGPALPSSSAPRGQAPHRP